MIVLDTNVLSELAKPHPDGSVFPRVARHRRADLCTIAISEAELVYGLALLPKGRRRARHWRKPLPACSAKASACGCWPSIGFGSPCGEIAARQRAIERPVATADGQIAAIVHARGAVLLVARDVVGLQDCGVPVIDPWRT